MLTKGYLVPWDFPWIENYKLIGLTLSNYILVLFYNLGHIRANMKLRFCLTEQLIQPVPLPMDEKRLKLIML